MRVKEMCPSVFILLILFGHIPSYDNARILGVFALNTKSHFLISEAIMKGLAARGHEVVVVSHFPQKKYQKNYTDINISGSLPGGTDNITTKIFTENRIFRTARFSWFDAVRSCKTLFANSKVHALLNSNEAFDLVIVEMPVMECFAWFSYQLKAPLVGVDTCVPLPWVHQRLGNPDNPAYNPGYLLPYTSRMNFWQRMLNTLTNTVLIAGNHFFCDEPTNALLKERFGDDVPPIQDILGKTSVLLVNTHFSFTEPRPTVPGYVEVGGLHIRETRTIPRDILEFMEGSEHGIVYFSMGSLVKVQSFPTEKIQALLETFASLPERVVMKYTGEKLPWTPRNVMVSKWLPQIDILCHPRTKLFIGHGGMLSVQESVKCGVPLVGITLFSDQHLNVHRLKELGMALKLNFDQINKEELLSAVRTVIDQRRRVSALFKDRPMTPLDTAVYWVEYVIRHRGAPHLRSAGADLPLYQYLLLDVMGFLLLCYSYSKNAKRVSALFKDRPMTPLDTAVYWVEYVIRHRGAPHMRSAGADLPLYQYLLLDVIGFLLLAVIVFIFAAHLVVRTVIRAFVFQKTKRE